MGAVVVWVTLGWLVGIISMYIHSRAMCNGRVPAIGGRHIRWDSTIQTVFVNAAAVFDSGYCTVRLQLKGAADEQVFSLSKFLLFWVFRKRAKHVLY